MPYFPVLTVVGVGAAALGAEAAAGVLVTPLSAACMRTLIVSRGWMVLWDAARAAPPARTSASGNTEESSPSTPVAAGAATADASTYDAPRRDATRRRGRESLPPMGFRREESASRAELASCGSEGAAGARAEEEEEPPLDMSRFVSSYSRRTAWIGSVARGRDLLASRACALC